MANGILNDPLDSEEIVNYTWLAAWDSIPPIRPRSLKAFFGTLIRRISVDRLRKRMAEKRGKGEALLAIDELSACIPSGWSMEKTMEERDLIRAFNAFLAKRPETERNLFVARYWYGLSIADISEKFGIKKNTVVSKLRRNRIRLLHDLEKEGLE